MATTIVPGVGQGVAFTQQGAGTTPGYSAIDDRRACLEGGQEGLVAVSASEATGWTCQQRTAGANGQVEIISTLACARVQGDSVTQQGLYTVAPHASTILETIAAADATNPRIDQVVLEVLDNVHDASGSSLARTRVIAGTATPGATLANRTGAAALPSNCFRLADLLIPANGAGTVTLANNQIRDRRTFAKGAHKKVLRNSNAASGNDYTTTSATPVAIDATNLNVRIECSGVPVKISLRAGFTLSAAAQAQIYPYVDGAGTDGGAQTRVTTTASQDIAGWFEWETTPAAGSHLFAWFWNTSAGTLTAFARLGNPVVMTVEEIVRQDYANNTITSG